MAIHWVITTHYCSFGSLRYHHYPPFPFQFNHQNGTWVPGRLSDWVIHCFIHSSIRWISGVHAFAGWLFNGQRCWQPIPAMIKIHVNSSLGQLIFCLFGVFPWFFHSFHLEDRHMAPPTAPKVKEGAIQAWCQQHRCGWSAMGICQNLPSRLG
jgi:hypothetical protein